MFIDSAVIDIEAGVGGNGIVAFRREKHVDLGGPFGGSGGRGGNIVFEVDEGLRTLLDFSFNNKFKADNGDNGRTKNQTGKQAEDLILKIPPGTVITDAITGEFISDMTKNKESTIVAKGGRGGRGNVDLAKAGRHSLEICENGEPGEIRQVKLELKLLADVGLVGLPSVGKSSLISVMSSAKPKIAAYHFTTITPNLGMCQTIDHRSFVIADLPGLIEGAAQGKGLGHQFLKHIERTKVIVHVIDMGSFEGRDPIDDYNIINKELIEYGFNLDERPQIVVANKMDLPLAQENLEKFKSSFPDLPIIEISTVTKTGIELLALKLADKLDEIGNIYYVADRPSRKVYKFEYDQEIEIFCDESGVFNVRGSAIEKLVAMTNFSTYDNIRRFSNRLRSMGVYEMLEDKGVMPGDLVLVMDYEFEYEN